jgi:hypothetical protein
VSITHSRPFTTVILFQGADLDPIAERRAAYQRAELERLADAPRRLGDDLPESEASEKARDHDEFMEGALERATHVKLGAVSRKKYRELLAAHPPRPDVKDPESGEVTETFPDDQRFGFDVTAMGEPLILGCLAAWDEDIRPTQPDVPERQFDSDRERQAFVDDLSDGEFSRLFSAAVGLNQGVGPDPKARLSSTHDRMSSAISGLLSSSD